MTETIQPPDTEVPITPENIEAFFALCHAGDTFTCTAIQGAAEGLLGRSGVLTGVSEGGDVFVQFPDRDEPTPIALYGVIALTPTSITCRMTVYPGNSWYTWTITPGSESVPTQREALRAVAEFNGWVLEDMAEGDADTWKNPRARALDCKKITARFDGDTLVAARGGGTTYSTVRSLVQAFDGRARPRPWWTLAAAKAAARPAEAHS